MQRIEKIGWNRILAWILLAASFLMVFLPWIRIEIRVLGKHYTPRNLMNLGMGLAGEEQYSDQELKEQIRESLLRQETELPVSEGAYLDAMICLLNGRMNPLQAARTGHTLSRVMAEEATPPDRAPIEERLEFYRLFDRFQAKLLVGAVLGWMLLAVLALCFLLALWDVYRGKTRNLRNQLLVSVALLALNGVAVWQCNSFVRDGLELMDASGVASSVLSMTGGLKLFHTGVAPFLCPILAALAWLALRWKSGSLPTLGWVCPTCGARHLRSTAFCPACGAPAPKAPADAPETPTESEPAPEAEPQAAEPAPQETEPQAAE